MPRNGGSKTLRQTCCGDILLTNAPQNMTTTVKEATHAADQRASCSRFSATGKVDGEDTCTGPSVGSVPTFLMAFQHKNADTADTTKYVVSSYQVQCVLRGAQDWLHNRACLRCRRPYIVVWVCRFSRLNVRASVKVRRLAYKDPHEPRIKKRVTLSYNVVILMTCVENAPRTSLVRLPPLNSSTSNPPLTKLSHTGIEISTLSFSRHSQIGPSGIVLHPTPKYGPVQEVRRQHQLEHQENPWRKEARRADAQCAPVDRDDAIPGQLQREGENTIQVFNHGVVLESSYRISV